MQATIELDDELIDDLRAMTGEQDLRVLVEQGLRALAEDKAIEHLIAMGGQAPDIEDIPRRRSPPA